MRIALTHNGRVKETEREGELPGRAAPRAHALATRAAPFAACLLAASGARAQLAPSLDARTWRPSPDPEANAVSEPVATPGHLNWNAALFASYALNPVVWREAGSMRVLARPVEGSVLANAVGSVGFGERVALGIDVPVVIWQDGTGRLPASVVQQGSAQTTGLGDVAVVVKVTLLGNDRAGLVSGVGVAAAGSVTVPTGDRQTFAGEGAATWGARLLGEYAVAAAALRAGVGFQARPETREWPVFGETFGNRIDWSLALVLRPKALLPSLDGDDRQIWEVGLHGGLPAGPIAPFGLGESGAEALSPALVAIDDRVALGHSRDLSVMAGVDVGLDHAVGVPVVRGILGVGWAPRVRDRDSDGVSDDVDQCPDLPEDRDGIEDEDGCPEDDADSDNVPDEADACPVVAGAASSDPKRNGCPATPSASAPPSGGK